MDTNIRMHESCIMRPRRGHHAACMHARRNIYTDVFIRPRERIQSAVYSMPYFYTLGRSVVYGMDAKGDSGGCTLSN